ncbi:SGNH hydrolase-type esterase domain containing protein [Parasponia andersonii]|uniref:SGNH hydrolase-type esterase domain containing protein n=1 Tax=Parasponia andersonii TaxID=3476 RepID=A0A2P5CTA9_PARAD|nr:SGNH hydrolase-type esterase domain containing protein [Parasponia andersonii]
MILFFELKCYQNFLRYNEFYDFHRRSQTARSHGEVFAKLLPKEEAFSEALYTIDIGQNDLTAGYFLNMSTIEVKAYVPDVLDQFKTIVEYQKTYSMS